MFCHVFSWRELDSLPGVSRNQEGAHTLSFNYNNIQHQPNGEGLDTEEEEVCIPLTRFFFLIETPGILSIDFLHHSMHRWRISLTLCI